MAFSDHLDLRTAVLEMVGRTDIADVFPRHLKLAEAHLNRELRTRDQATSAPITTVDRRAALPSDFLQVIDLFNADDFRLAAQPISEMQQDDYYGYFSNYGNYGYYAIQGRNLWARDAVYTLRYYSKIPTIADSITASNWLLESFPETYLYAALYEAAKHVRDPDLVAIKQLRDEAVMDVKGDDDLARYAAARVRVDGVTP